MSTPEVEREVLPAGFVRSIDQRFPRARWMLVLAIMLGSLNALTVRHVSNVSPIDEQTYIDQFVKAADFELDQPGDILSQETLRELCARRAAFVDYPPCRSGRMDPRKFSESGINRLQPQPVYFFATAPVARFLRFLSPIELAPNDSLVGWGRLLGTIWLLVGCYLTLRIAECFRARPRMVVAGLVAAAASPALLHATTIINPDAASFAMGSATLLSVLAWEQRKVGIWVPIVVSGIAVLTKLPNSLAVVIAVMYLIARGLQAWRGESAHHEADRGGVTRSLREYAIGVSVLVVVAAVAARGWSVVYDLLERHVVGKSDVDIDAEAARNPALRKALDAYTVDRFHLKWVTGDQVVPSMLPPVVDIAPPADRIGGIYSSFGSLSRVLFSAPLVAVVVAARNVRSRLFAFASASLVGVLVTGPLFVLYWYFALRTSDAIYPRYGLSAMAVFVVFLAMVAGRGRVGRWFLPAFAGAAWVAALLTNF